ncbi:glycosyltransferase family 2 protein [Pontibacter silvestris]|uniref:Glycosyltransferase family 2 protein n=1 Tax=Pontibacter silvestris TaxID=2305183 RepID=A0ABW4WW62_9BACT|nr:glycosyltransferase family 2 protein [Pontibacter silvestris]MCC9137343.1 glycosyltransferase [Pontibacter silvestris]
MKISIITINYNNAVGLRQTIECVITQSFKDFEYIVIDGGSSDGSVELIKEFEENIDYWSSEKDNGVYHAMNKGILKATGAYLMFLNSGDKFSDEKSLEYCAKYIEKVPERDIYYGDMYAINHNHVNIPNNSYWKHPKELDLIFLKKDTINHQSALISSKLFLEFGLYPESNKLASDYWLWIKSLINDKVFEHIEYPIIIYDFNGMSASDNFKAYRLEKQEIWNSVVPLQVRNLVDCTEILIEENLKLKQLVNRKSIKALMAVQRLYQKICK